MDVLVIGAGPSGLTVAAEVARTGASVLVLERREVEPIPRAGTVLPRPLELFGARGIAEQFIRRTTEVNPNPYQSFHIWAGMAPVSWSARDSRFGFTLMLAQHETEEVLRRWTRDCGVELRFGHEVVEVHDKTEDRSMCSERRFHMRPRRGGARRRRPVCRPSCDRWLGVSRWRSGSALLGDNGGNDVQDRDGCSEGGDAGAGFLDLVDKLGDVEGGEHSGERDGCKE